MIYGELVEPNAELTVQGLDFSQMVPVAEYLKSMQAGEEVHPRLRSVTKPQRSGPVASKRYDGEPYVPLEMDPEDEV